jgi:hypothetical protein
MDSSHHMREVDILGLWAQCLSSTALVNICRKIIRIIILLQDDIEFRTKTRERDDGSELYYPWWDCFEAFICFASALY